MHHRPKNKILNHKAFTRKQSRKIFMTLGQAKMGNMMGKLESIKEQTDKIGYIKTKMLSLQRCLSG